MYVLNTHRILAAALLFTVIAGSASAADTKPTATLATSAQAKMALMQPVVVMIGTASLEEYRQADPSSRTEVTHMTLVQRLQTSKTAPSRDARS